MTTLATTLPASTARSSFYTILDQVSNKLKRFTITHRGKAQAVVLHPDEVAAWEETMDILADNQLLSQLASSESDRKSGKTISQKKLLENLHLSPQDLLS
jgi:PHD/YefM family antitoxin component YafN of YafNO toxin-antitoxin module